jgi:antibiotic biosynthesis monooxygenase (ABM) superfamily enzyme
MAYKDHPKKWKMAILTWIAIYPTITILLALSEGVLHKIQPMPLRTLAFTLVLVPLMVFLLVPLLQRKLSQWLHS